MSIYYCNECKDEAYVRYLRYSTFNTANEDPTKFVMSEEEGKILWEIVKDQYISYEHPEQHVLLSRLMGFLKERERIKKDASHTS